MPTRPASQATTVSIKSEVGDVDSAFGSNDNQQLSSPQPSGVQERASVSNDNNILLDPDVLSDHVTQVLVLTVLATLVKYTTDENEVRILYEYLAEASVVFPKVFPVIHSLLDAKITNVLSLCHDKTILAAVQSIIENMISCEDTSQQQLHFLQSCGFGGLWRFAGPFTKSNCNAENVEQFIYCGVRGFLDKIDPAKITEFEKQFLAHVKGTQKPLLDQIGADGHLSPESDAALNKIVSAFVAGFSG